MSSPLARWQCRDRELDLGSPVVMGVLNVTPDSFSDGGQFLAPGAALRHALRMVEEGARIIDVGGESTRPGASPAALSEELARVVPLIAALRAETDAFISVDTSKPDVMRAAVEAGADIINDVRALREPGALAAAAATGAGLCLMHMQGEPRTMQVAPQYDDVVSDVLAFLEERVAFAVERGIAEERICVDPGIGFGKTPDQNLELLRRLEELSTLGRPVLVGVSRKSTLGKVAGDAAATRGSPAASLGAAVSAFERGAWMIRAHDVRETVEALAVAAAVERGKIDA